MHESMRKRKGHWESFDDIDGLSHECWCVLEDKDGNIWIGTRSGLSRFDGKEFVNLSGRDGLPDINVQCLHQDRAGNIWIGTRNGLSRYDGKRFVNFTDSDGLAHNFVQCLREDNQGNIWIGTLRGLSQYDGDAFVNLSEEDGLITNNVHDIHQDKQGNIWIGTSGGLSQYDGVEFVNFTQKDGLASNYVRCLLQDRDGNIWIGTDNGLSRYDGVEFVNFTEQDGMAGNYVQCLYQDRDGNIWIGTPGGGVSYYENGEFVNFNTEHGLAHNNVYDIIQDREGSIWFACHHGGISRYEPYGISYISDESVSEVIMRDSAGNLWWGAENVLSRFDGKSTKHYHLEHGIYELFEDSKGQFWIGTDSGGIFRYDSVRSFEEQKPQNLTVRDGLISNWAVRIREDTQGNIWIGSSGGACSYDGMEITKFTTNDGLGSNLISMIFPDSKGMIWFAGWEGGGVTRYDGKTFHTYTKDDGLADNRVVCMTEDDENNLWIGTSAGVSCYDGEVFRTYTTADGLSGNFIQRMLRDSRGQIWIATLGGGISRFDGSNFQVLTKEDGLPSNNVTGIIEEPDGGIIISTYKGICKYMPGQMSPPLIRIDEVDADRIYMEPEKIMVSEGASSLRIKYHGVSFRTKRIRYSYTLEGYDESWKATWDEEVRYENLPLGEYTFKVVAVDRDLTYSEKPAVLRLEVIADVRDQVISELEEKVRERTGELREAKDYIDNVVKSMLNSLIVVEDQIIKTVNQATLDLLGYTESELIGKPIGMILAEDELLEESDLNDILATDSILDVEREFIRNIENTYVSKDGRRIPVLFSGSVMRDDNGEIQGLVCVAENMAERKQAEERNRRQNRFLRSVLESLTHPFYVIDAHDYTIKMANPAARLKGLSEGETCYGASHGVSKPCQTIGIECPVQQITGTKKPVTVEHIHYNGNGGPRNVEVHGYPILDEAGNVTQIIEYCLDITERKRAEEELTKHRDHLEELVEERTRELRESEEMYRTIFETTGTAAVMVEADNTISLANTEFEKLSGYSREELEGKESWTKFPTKESLARLQEYHRLRMIDPETAPRSYEAQFVNSKGEIKDCLITVSIIAGTKTSVVLVADITEHKEEAERIQAAKMEALRQLVAGVAHQMNSPIGAISSNNDISSRAVSIIRQIMTEEYPQELEEHKQLMRSLAALEKTSEVSQAAADSIAKIVTNLRHFVRLDEAEWQFADIHEGIDNVIALMEQEFSNRIRVTKNYGNIPKIYCSPSSLNQVFMSLFRNASEAIVGEGEILVRTSDQGECIRIEISDTGRGIPAEEMDRIFDPGFTTKGVRVGVGLGLSICYKIAVNEHRGHIDVSSESGKGTTFTITLPKRSDRR